MATLNYATQYQRELDQVFPYVLNFGALFATPNNGRYRWVNAKTIEIPRISTTGRVNADRDTIATASRNYDNSWETKTLQNERKWSTLVHPMDIDETNMTTTIGNITRVFNEEQKFPEMDAYLVSKIYNAWTTSISSEGYVGKVADSTILDASNVLETFDRLMLNMDNARVPYAGRILYCTNEIKTMLKQCSELYRSWDVQTSAPFINRTVNRLDEVEVVGVPAELMMTAYVFTTGWAVAPTADRINMFLVHPMAVITPHKYEFSQLEAPSALSEGKYVYYEESYEDAFILNNKADAIQYNVSKRAVGLTVASAAGTASGDTKLTVTPAAASGNSRYYALGAVGAFVGDIVDTAKFTAWDGSADITAPTGSTITVVEVDSDKKIVKAGSATVTAKA